MEIKTLHELEKEQIIKVLEQTHWNKDKTARLLQIPISQLNRKIRKHCIEKQRPDQSTKDHENITV